MGGGVGVRVGVGVAVGLAVGDDVGACVGVAVGLGVAVGRAELLGFAVGMPALPGVDGVEEWDGASATDGWDVDPGALCDPSTSDEVHKSNPPTPAHRTSRRSTNMGDTPPTYH